MKRSSAYITLVLVLVIIGAVLCIRLFVPEDDAPAAPTGGIRAPVAEDTAPPAPSDAVPEPIVLTPPPPSATLEPLPTPTEPPETAPPAATNTPVATPQPVVAEASGSFSSDTGTYLNMLVEWKLYTDEAGAAKLQVTLSATHYSLRVDELADGLELNVNGEVYRANSPTIRYEGRGFVTTPMHTFTVDAPVGAMRISATWHYRGSYSNKELNDITATDTYYPQ